MKRLTVLLLIVAGLYAQSPFTSVQTGNWNDGATWGNTSPGVKGTDWPGSTADVFTVSVGDTVTYNVSEANELGASTIDGTLTFSRGMSTLLAFGHANLTVSATGTLDIGTDASVIPAAYAAELTFNTTSNDVVGLAITNGGICTFFGDPTYCTIWESTLANDAENTDDDAVIVINDDRSADWHVGDEITIRIENVGTSSIHQTGVVCRTIQSMSGDTLTLTETVTGVTAGVGDTWTSEVINVTRNVKMYKLGAVTDIQSSSRYNSNRPRLIDANSGTNNNIWANVQFTGLSRVTAVGSTFDNCVIRNSDNTFSSCNNNSILNVIVYACSRAINISHNNLIESVNLYAIATAFNSSNNNLITGNLYACAIGFNASYYNLPVVNIYACDKGFNSSHNVVGGKFGYTSGDVSSPNATDILTSFITLKNVKMPLSGLSFSGRNDVSGLTEVTSEHHDKVLNAHVIYRNMGDVIKLPFDGSGTSPSADPEAGNGDGLEVSNLQTNLTASTRIKVFNDYQYAVWATASVEKTYTFNVQSTFTENLTADDFYLSASYLSSTDGTLTDSASVETVAPRTGAADWTQELSVTITTAQTGFVYFQISLCKYETGSKVYVWPKVDIN